MKVAACGGGTGGHTLPVLAVIKSIIKTDKDTKVIFLGSRFGLENKLIPKMGVKYYGISTGKYRRYHKSKLLNLIDPTTFFSNTADFFRFIKGIRESYEILAHEKPDVLFAKGGFVSLPVGIAARLLKIPIIIHESDLVMGMANKRLASFAEKVCVSFPVKNYTDIKPEKLVETGNPIRNDILMGDADKFRRGVGFNKDVKTILILGGSQGSLFINETVLEIIKEILFDFQVIWVAGERDFDFVKSHLAKLDEQFHKKVKVYGFVTSEMSNIYAASDLVITRSGSNVLFELAALGKPAFLIPHDVSSGGHQFENARLFSRAGAAFIFPQEKLTPKKLLSQIKYILSNSKELNSMSEKMRSLSDVGAADKLTKIIFEIGEEHFEQSRELKKEE